MHSRINEKQKNQPQQNSIGDTGSTSAVQAVLVCPFFCQERHMQRHAYAMNNDMQMNKMQLPHAKIYQYITAKQLRKLTLPKTNQPSLKEPSTAPTVQRFNFKCTILSYDNSLLLLVMDGYPVQHSVSSWLSTKRWNLSPAGLYAARQSGFSWNTVPRFALSPMSLRS